MNEYQSILTTCLTGELTVVLDKLELILSNNRDRLLSERLDLKRAREQLNLIISKLEPTIEELHKENRKLIS